MTISGGSGSQSAVVGQTVVRPMRRGDMRQVLAIARQAFPSDPWTLETAGGWLARSPLGRHRRGAAALERVIMASRLTEVALLCRLVGYFARGQPGTQYRIVAEADQKILGFACLEVSAGSGKVQTMAVRRAHRSRGTGTALLADLVATATARGCRDIVLDVRADNAQARGLYQRAGFAEIEVQSRFYQPSGTDAVVMKLSTGVSARTH